MSQPRVAVAMGSDSDLPVMQKAIDLLDQFGIVADVRVMSAHRSPGAVAEFAESAQAEGLHVIIAAAGGSAHLAGVIAAHTVLPVIGVPIDSSPLKGVDALYSTVQMPPGVPVATVGINAALNAALLAIQILAVGDAALRRGLAEYKAELAQQVEQKSQAVRERLRKERE